MTKIKHSEITLHLDTMTEAKAFVDSIDTEKSITIQIGKFKIKHKFGSIRSTTKFNRPVVVMLLSCPVHEQAELDKIK